MRKRLRFLSPLLRPLNRLGGGLLELVYPQRCLLCAGSSPEPLCAACAASFSRITGAVCTTCGKPCVRPVERCRECAGKEFAFMRARSAGIYTGKLKEAVHHLKYANGKRIAPYLSRFMYEEAALLADDIDLVAYVPLTAARESRRGYNQSRLIARDLAHRFGKPLCTQLVKVRSVPEQHTLGLADRGRNVKGAFKAKGRISGRVLLVDDVYTTGSTASECARALKESGASEVIVLTVARTLRDRV